MEKKKKTNLSGFDDQHAVRHIHSSQLDLRLDGVLQDSHTRCFYKVIDAFLHLMLRTLDLNVSLSFLRLKKRSVG